MRSQTAAVALAATLLATGSAALAQPGAFSFKSVEFMAESQREPAAMAFIQDNIHPGMAVDAATQVLKKAGAFCHAPHGGQVLCTHSSFQRHPFHDLTDVTWTVTLVTTPDGMVSSADVVRTTQE